MLSDEKGVGEMMVMMIGIAGYLWFSFIIKNNDNKKLYEKKRKTTIANDKENIN